MKKLLLITVLALLSGVTFGQMKIGSNPSQINKSSILELESTRQGLLLPRVPGANITSAPLNAAPDGMIIYITDSTSLYIRRNGNWQRMSVDSINNNQNWNLLGNAGSDSLKNFIGTKDKQALVFKVNDAERFRVNGNGNVQFTSGTVASGTNQVDVLVLDPSTGTLLQRSIAPSAFDNAIVAINGLRDTVQKFTIDSASAVDMSFVSTAGDGTAANPGVHKLNIPTQNGNGTTSRGLLSYKDWARFDSAYRFQILHTLFSVTPNVNGISTDIATGTLTLHAADATNPGGVSILPQNFAGTKNFKDSLSVGMPVGTSSNSTFEVNGSMGSNITTMNSSGTLDATSNTILANASSGALTITLPAAAGIKGRIYTIKKIGTGDIDNPVTINPGGGTIDGGSSYTIYNDWTFVTLQTDGTNWYIIKK